MGLRRDELGFTRPTTYEDTKHEVPIKHLLWQLAIKTLGLTVRTLRKRIHRKPGS